MERVLECQDAVLASRCAWRIGGSAAVEAGELESAFDGFRAAIGEEHAVHAGPLRRVCGPAGPGKSCERDWKDG